MVVDIGLEALSFERRGVRQNMRIYWAARIAVVRMSLNKMANYASTRSRRRLTMSQTPGGGAANSSASTEEANL
jgi:hypothetical protein